MLYKERLEKLRDMFVEKCKQELANYKSIAHGGKLFQIKRYGAIIRDEFQDVFGLNLISKLANIILWHAPKVADAQKVVKLLSLSENELFDILSEGIFRAARNFEDKIVDDNIELGKLAEIAKSKLFFVLEKKDIYDGRLIQVQDIVDAIMASSLDLTIKIVAYDPFLNNPIQDKNYKVVNGEDLRIFFIDEKRTYHYLKEHFQDHDNYERQIYFLPEAIQILEEKGLKNPNLYFNFREFYGNNILSLTPVMDYVMRGEELGKIHSFFSQRTDDPIKENKVMLLYGFEGAGKKELAKIYYTEYCGDYLSGAVFINAESKDTLQQSFIDVIGSQSDVLKYLSKTDNEKMLLVYADCKDLSILQEYLSNHNNHHIIITTETISDKWYKLSNPTRFNVLQIGEFNSDESIEFVEKQIKKASCGSLSVSKDDAKNLVKAVYPYPFVLKLVTDYIGTNRKPLYRAIEEINRATDHSVGLTSYEVTVNNVLKVIFNALREGTKECQLAYQIIANCVYLGKDNIPKYLFEGKISGFDGADYDGSVAMLERHALISQDPNLELFSINSKMIQKYIEAHFTGKRFSFEKVKNLFYKSLPVSGGTSNPENYDYEHRLINHFKTFIDKDNNHPDKRYWHKDLGNLLLFMGMIEEALKQYDHAKGLLNDEDSLSTVLDSECGNYQELQVNIFRGMGSAYERLGDFEKALECYNEVLSLKEEKIEKAKTFYSISAVKCRIGNYREANEYSLKALEEMFPNVKKDLLDKLMSDHANEAEINLLKESFLDTKNNEELKLAGKLFMLLGDIEKGKFVGDRLTDNNSILKTAALNLERLFGKYFSSKNHIRFYMLSENINRKIYENKYENHFSQNLLKLNIIGIKLITEQRNLHEAILADLNHLYEVFSNRRQSLEKAITLKYIGDYHLYNGNYDLAIDRYNKVLELDGNKIEYVALVNLFLGHAYFLGKCDYDNAKIAYKEAAIDTVGGYRLKGIASDTSNVLEASKLLLLPMTLKNLLESSKSIRYIYQEIFPAKKLPKPISEFFDNKPLLLSIHIGTSLTATYLIPSSLEYKYGMTFISSSLYVTKLYSEEIYVAIKDLTQQLCSRELSSTEFFSLVTLYYGSEVLSHLLATTSMNMISRSLSIDLAVRAGFDAIDYYYHDSSTQKIHCLIPLSVDLMVAFFVAKKTQWSSPVLHINSFNDVATNLIFIQQTLVVTNVIAFTDHLTKTLFDHLPVVTEYINYGINTGMSFLGVQGVDVMVHEQ